jgi:adenylate kinase
MNLIIFGPPGAGKGTQSNFIVNKYDLFQLSTGRIFREEVKNKTELGVKIASLMRSGSLIENKIVNKLIEGFVSNIKYKNKFIFDGYPRNTEQANNLDTLLEKYEQKIDLVLNLSVSLDIVKKRISGRSVCSICGKIYNDFFNPPPKNSSCCTSKFLQKRSDDTLDIAVKRFQTYEKNMDPLIKFYKDLNLLKSVNGERTIPQINGEISEIIDSIEG